MKNSTKIPCLGALIVGCVFFFFLIFAQFGFLHRLAGIEARENLIEMAMFAMGFGGIASSVFTARRFRIADSKSWLIVGFVGCGLAALLSIVTTNIWIQLGVAVVVGLSLGSLTVSVVPTLRALVPAGRIGVWASLGVGGAYLLSNAPAVFRSSAEGHCLLGALACSIGVVVALSVPALKEGSLKEFDSPVSSDWAFFETKGAIIIASLFLALIWLDSAAFYIIQNSEELKLMSWNTDIDLWVNACIHLLLALVGGWLLDRGWLFSMLIVSFVLLGAGAWSLQHGIAEGGVGTVFYVSGVSLYSVALVAYGALAPERLCSWSISARAGLVFALGGWFGSGMGIGMARDLKGIPDVFFAFAGLLVIGCLLGRWKLKKNDEGRTQ
jgi:hypothetical protein